MNSADFEIDPDELERENREQAMHEDGFSNYSLWMPKQQDWRTA